MQTEARLYLYVVIRIGWGKRAKFPKTPETLGTFYSHTEAMATAIKAFDTSIGNLVVRPDLVYCGTGGMDSFLCHVIEVVLPCLEFGN